MMLRRFGVLSLLAAFTLMPACSGCGDDTSVAENNFGHGGKGGKGSGGSTSDGPLDTLIGFDQSTGGETGATCPGGCPEGQFCSNGVCVTQSDCQDDDDCANDSYCDPATGCIPWGTPPGKDHDPNCQIGLPPGNFAPTVKCEFKTPPAGDPFPSHTDVQATPTVVNFNAATQGVPSIVAPFTAPVVSSYTENQGVIRILRGDTCELEANLGGGQAGLTGFLISSASVAAGDLNGDKVADLVARGADGRLVAFARTAGTWGVLWTSAAPVALGVNWAGPSIHDLDDDGVPEVILDATVVAGDTGAIKGSAPAGYATHSQGLDPVLADLDQDPKIELTNGQSVWEWTTAGWVLEPGFPGATASAPGFPAVADFGAFGAGIPTENPEIVVVRNNQVMIHAIDGSYALAPITIPTPPTGSAGGGPPTIADYDGDGLPEVGVAGQAFLTIFDIDCTTAPRPNGACAAGNLCEDFNSVRGPCPAGILWSRRTQDISSNITGSSVFDFEDDGKAEVVYADECFVRVYDGTDGDVLFSQFHSSCTWYENPIVADTDGNFRADLVTPNNLACAPDLVNGIACGMLEPGSGVDTQFAGLRCVKNSDCVSNLCDNGFCRCSSTAQCCAAATDAACLDQGFSCAAPPSGTPGTGNTCRAAHPRGVSGIRVYSDANDQWVRSRTIWNQHAYHVTHVNEDGTIPQTSAWQKNWLQKSLNNFRQNVPGEASGQDIPDMTAGASGVSCNGGTAVLSVPVCNRGTAPIGGGVTVGFYDPAGTKVCEAQTVKPLQPGECETVTCQWGSPPAENGVEIKVVADDGEDRTECKEGNNEGSISGVRCKPPT